MTIDKEINIFEQKLVSDINGSGLSPAIIRLILNEVLASVKELERNNLATDETDEAAKKSEDGGDK